MKWLLKRMHLPGQFRRENNNFLLFLDKTRFNLHIASQHGYAFLGEALYNIVSANREKSVSLLVMISISGIIHHKIIDGSYTFSLFLKFLNKYKDENFFTFNCIIVIDNEKIYYTDEIKTFVWIIELENNIFLLIPHNLIY